MAKTSSGHDTGYGVSIPRPTKIRGGGSGIIQPTYDAGAGPGTGTVKKSTARK